MVSLVAVAFVSFSVSCAATWSTQGHDASHTGLGDVPGPLERPSISKTLTTYGDPTYGLVSGSPVSDGAGRLFVVTGGAAGAITVRALDATSGASLWNWTTSGAASGAISTPTYANASGSLFITGQSVSALNAATGTPLGTSYTAPAGCTIVGDPTPSVAGGAYAVQVGCAQAAIVALAPNCSVLWTVPLPAFSSAATGFAPALSSDGSTLVACATPPLAGGLADGVLAAVDVSTAAALWSVSGLQGGCIAPPMFSADPAETFVFQAVGSANALRVSAVLAFDVADGSSGGSIFSTSLLLKSAPVSGPRGSDLLLFVDATAGAPSLVGGTLEGGAVWSVALSKSGAPPAPALAVGAYDQGGNFTVFVTNGASGVLAVDGATGEARWGLDLGAAVASGGGIAGLALGDAPSSLLVAAAGGDVLFVEPASFSPSPTSYPTPTRSGTPSRSQTHTISITRTPSSTAVPWPMKGCNPQHVAGAVYGGPPGPAVRLGWAAPQAAVTGSALLVPRSGALVYGFCGASSLCAVDAATGALVPGAPAAQAGLNVSADFYPGARWLAGVGVGVGAVKGGAFAPVGTCCNAGAHVTPPPAPPRSTRRPGWHALCQGQRRGRLAAHRRLCERLEFRRGLCASRGGPRR